jgi:hypothetical protein
VWSQLEKADSSFAEVQNWSQRSLPLRQRQKVEKMLRSLICARKRLPAAHENNRQGCNGSIRIEDQAAEPGAPSS